MVIQVMVLVEVMEVQVQTPMETEVTVVAGLIHVMGMPHVRRKPPCSGGAGGFGHGGCGQGGDNGGGGGGYSGGASGCDAGNGYGGGGGGSYSSGVIESTWVNASHGYVIIDKL